jgi:nucleoside-diphosphate-sugar epimerase
LIGRGDHVRAATHHLDLSRARALGRLGARLVAADFDDPDSLAAAARGVDTVFAAGTAHAAGPDGDVRHGMNITDAAVRAGVPHLLYVGVAGADERTPTQSADAVSRVLGRTVPAVAPFPDPPNPLSAWLDRVGNHVDIAALRARYPEIGWHDVDTWARQQDWCPLATGPHL